MFHHELMVINFTIWVNGYVSKLEAFASICPVPTNEFMVLAFILNFPRATPLDCKELDNVPRPPTGTVRVVRRPMGPLHPTPPAQFPSVPRHQLPCFGGMSMLWQQQGCKPLIACNQVPERLWRHSGSSSSYIFRQ